MKNIFGRARTLITQKGSNLLTASQFMNKRWLSAGTAFTTPLQVDRSTGFSYGAIRTLTNLALGTSTQNPQLHIRPATLQQTQRRGEFPAESVDALTSLLPQLATLSNDHLKALSLSLSEILNYIKSNPGEEAEALFIFIRNELSTYRGEYIELAVKNQDLGLLETFTNFEVSLLSDNISKIDKHHQLPHPLSYALNCYPDNHKMIELLTRESLRWSSPQEGMEENPDRESPYYNMTMWSICRPLHQEMLEIIDTGNTEKLEAFIENTTKSNSNWDEYIYDKRVVRKDPISLALSDDIEYAKKIIEMFRLQQSQSRIIGDNEVNALQQHTAIVMNATYKLSRNCRQYALGMEVK